MNWFNVDKKGLAKLIEKRGKASALIELLQNAWDSDAKHVSVIVKSSGKGEVYIEVVDDDPKGFADLTHAFTLFAESTKKHDATKRGRFNLGEKLALALCYWARIESTTGTYEFSDLGGRRSCRDKRKEGSAFFGRMSMNKQELEETLAKITTLIPPEGIVTKVNGEELSPRKAIATFEAQLQTEISDEEGVLRKTIRKTTVSIYDPLPGETPSIYELGIPVVETGDKWHVNVGQKVPLNFNRDNVTPAYLRELRTYVLNSMFDRITKDEASDAWVREATSSDKVSQEAVDTVMKSRFGEKAVVFDPSDPEANKLATAAGYTVVPGRALSKDEWANVKKAGLLPAAGIVTPSPKPFSPDGKPLNFIPRAKWTEPMQRRVKYIIQLHRGLIGIQLADINITNDSKWPFAATYGDRIMILNLGRLGAKWFEKDNTAPAVTSLLLHEFAHYYSKDHLSEKYYNAICELGGNLLELALNSTFFEGRD